jgi:Domain of unknown function (DUF4375)
LLATLVNQPRTCFLTLCEALVAGFREGIQEKAIQKGERALTKEERAVLTVAALEEEVNNGGFDQFFRNSSRRFAPQVADSFYRGK